MSKQLRITESKINEESPFSDCKLDRLKYAENLTRIIENYPSGFVMALNNRWGDGKTFFVNRWRQLLKNQEFQTIYYNAWEDDYSENALVSILAELRDDIQEPDKKLLDNLLEKGTGLFVKSLTPLAKIITKKIVGNEGFEDLAELIGKEMGKPFSKLIDDYKLQKESVKNFKKTLSEFARVSGKGRPIVFFIDELDRCKPSFAIEVLEIIKHLFDVDNVVFVLSVDKEQLANCVRGYYGSDKIDGNEYLKKFIDLEYSLPKPDLRNFFQQEYLRLDFKSALQEDRLKHSELMDDNNNFTFLINLFVEDRGLNLRQVERLLSKTRLVMYSFNANHYMWPSLLTILVYLSNEMPKDFQRIKNKEISLSEILELNMKLLDGHRYLNRDLIPNSLVLHEFAFFSLYRNYAFGKKTIELGAAFVDKYGKYSFQVSRLNELLNEKPHRVPELELTLEVLLLKIELAETLTINN